MIGTLPIERLELLESQLHPSGARYLALKVVPLPMPIAEFTA
jgi:hypothetical protein